eukprot:8762649-Pyramimonas_sp.AAC.1
MGGGDACRLRHWDLRWSSYGAKKRVRGVPTWVAGTHVGTATGAFGVAPYGATKRMRGVPTWVAGTHVGTAPRAFGGASYLEMKRVRGVPK